MHADRVLHVCSRSIEGLSKRYKKSVEVKKKERKKERRNRIEYYKKSKK